MRFFQWCTIYRGCAHFHVGRVPNWFCIRINLNKWPFLNFSRKDNR